MALTRVDKLGDGVSIRIEVVMNYGVNIIDTLTKFKDKTKTEIEKQTSMNIVDITIVAKGIHFKDE